VDRGFNRDIKANQSVTVRASSIANNPGASPDSAIRSPMDTPVPLPRFVPQVIRERLRRPVTKQLLYFDRFHSTGFEIVLESIRAESLGGGGRT